MKKKGKKSLALVAASVLLAGCLFGGCGELDTDIVVYAPDGAPALALAQLLAEDTAEDGVTYKIAQPTAIASKVTYAEEGKNADLCVLPATAASKLLGSGERYVMLGAVTHGNLYLLGKEGAYSRENLSELVGKTVGVLQINEVPGLTFKATLQKLGIPYQEWKNGEEKAADKVNLLAISGAEAVGAVPADLFVVAEPAASAQASKGYKIVGDLQALYGGERGYTQAVLVAKRGLVEERAGWTKAFVSKVRASASWLKTASGEELVAAVSAHLEDEGAQTGLKAPLLKAEVLARCGISFTYAVDARAETEELLSALKGVNDKAAAIPAAEFYWEYAGE